MSGLPPVRHRPGLGTGCTVLFLGSPCSLSPFVFLAPRSCPVRRSCFRYPARPASVPRAPCAALRLLLPLVFAARPTVRASFLPSASPRSHVSHMCPHSMASPQLLAQLVPALVPLSAPKRHEFGPGRLPVQRRGNWPAGRNHHGGQHPAPPGDGLRVASLATLQATKTRLTEFPLLPRLPRHLSLPAQPPGQSRQMSKRSASSSVPRSAGHRRRSPWSACSWLEKTPSVWLLR